MAHLKAQVQQEPELRSRLAESVRRRHEELKHTVGLNAEVFDALILLSAGSWEHDALRQGSERVGNLLRDMDEARQNQLKRLGFDNNEATELSAMHTRNFM